MKNKINSRIVEIKEFINSEALSEREKNLLRGEISFLDDLLDMHIVN